MTKVLLTWHRPLKIAKTVYDREIGCSEGNIAIFFICLVSTKYTYLFVSSAAGVETSMTGIVNYLLQNFSQGYLCNYIYRPYHGLHKVSKFCNICENILNTLYFSLAKV